MFGSIRFASSLIIEKANQSHISSRAGNTPSIAVRLGWRLEALLATLLFDVLPQYLDSRPAA
jgi:hypothetical protein